MSKPFYITTPLYYVNDKPHIGHAYTNILCDTLARFRRFQGKEVFFLTGTDEHGEKIDKTAKKEGLETKEFIDRIVPRFKALWEQLDITYDHFIRTTDAYHRESVYRLISELEKKGDVYKGQYSGWYCTPCESFWIGSQLLEGKCPDCRRDVSQIQEENYFFKMSKYQAWLIQYMADNPGFIQPAERSREILGFLQQPLEDLCITRPRARLTWGIPYPNSNDYVIYVWFDALTNYISAAGYGSGDEKRFSRLWPADVHMVGKDIIRHHAVYWTIMLHALGLPQPKTIFGHGWWTISGTKVSKSLGNIVDPAEVSKNFGVDTLRYYFLHEVTLGSDGAYSEALLVERYNKDLANELGNLVQRVLSMAERYFKGIIPARELSKEKSDIESKAKGLGGRITSCVEHFQLREAVEEIWVLIRACNKYVDDTKPWALAKDPAKQKDLQFVLMSLLEGIRVIGVALTPFLPVTSKNILELLSITTAVSLKDLDAWWVLKPGTQLNKPRVLFPKMETEDLSHG